MATQANTPRTTHTAEHTRLCTAEQLAQSSIFPSGVITVRMIKEWAYRRWIPSVKLGRHRLYDMDAVAQHLRARTILPRV